MTVKNTTGTTNTSQNGSKTSILASALNTAIGCVGGSSKPSSPTVKSGGSGYSSGTKSFGGKRR